MIRYDGEEIAAGMKLSHNADIMTCIFESITDYDNGDSLPGLFFTTAVYDSNNQYVGHTCTLPYTGEDDPDGFDAWHYGAQLYEDGMQLSDPEQAKARLDCFRAAELFYRHASAKGNPLADLCLGYVYYYDRCQGFYWQSLSSDDSGPFPTKERAFECFKRAAQAGLAEASYKLGDCYKNGIGCEINEQEAFACYQQAADQDEGNATYLTGSIALRLGTCFEEGIGCIHDFERALEQYRRAESFLEAAVATGDWYYKKALTGARDGITRCTQELDLGV